MTRFLLTLITAPVEVVENGGAWRVLCWSGPSHHTEFFSGSEPGTRVAQAGHKMPVGSSKNPAHGRPHHEEIIYSHNGPEALYPWETEDSSAGGASGTCK